MMRWWLCRPGKLSAPLLAALLVASVLLNAALLSRDLLTTSAHLVPATRAAPTLAMVEHVRWDDRYSSCQVVPGMKATLYLQMFTTRLQHVIPPPEDFDPSFRTPCWRSYMHISPQILNIFHKSSKKKSVTEREISTILSSIFQSKPYKSLVCLPGVFFMGFPRSGSTQLYKMLIEHPHLKGGFRKESHWWTKTNFTAQFPQDIADMVHYLSFFQQSLAYIEQHPNTLLIDASQSTIWDTRRSGNTCFLPQLISAMFPASKFIVLMRDPAERLYSDFNYLCSEELSKRHTTWRVPEEYTRNRSSMFHRVVLTEIEKFRKCLERSSLEHCTHHGLSGSNSTGLCGHVRLGISLYHVHIRRWLREFPRSQFLFLRTDDLAAKPLALLEEAWQFLGVARQHAEDVGSLLHEHLHSAARHDSNENLAMSERTKALLSDFFQPYNNDLADLLGDEGFRW